MMRARAFCSSLDVRGGRAREGRDRRTALPHPSIVAASLFPPVIGEEGTNA